MEQPRSVADVLERVRTSWAGLLEVFDDLSNAQLVQAGPEGWSIKDHLAHIAAWDRVPTAILSGQPQHDAFGLNRAAYERIDSVDQLNDIIYQRHRNRSLAEVRGELQLAHSNLVAAVEALNDADLDRSIASFGADLDDHRPMREKIEGDTYGHYAEHTVWLRDLRAAIMSS